MTDRGGDERDGAERHERPLCVIPARGGSKRLPRKNLLTLAGRPMISWMIDAAEASGVFAEVVVSTEDEEIAAVAQRLGAQVHERSPDLAQDMSSSADVCLDVAARMKQDGRAHTTLVCLQPTSPLTTAADISGAWSTFSDSGAAFLVSVTPIDPHYFHWAVEPGEAGWRPFFGDKFMRDRLELPAVYRPNGAIKVADIAALQQRGDFFGGPLAAHMMPEERSIHVAHPVDARIAAMLLGDNDDQGND